MAMTIIAKTKMTLRSPQNQVGAIVYLRYIKQKSPISLEGIVGYCEELNK